MPTLETPEGGVWESNAIARYVARASPAGAALLGATPIDAAHVDQWVDFTTGEIDAPLLSWYLPIAGIWPHSAEKEAAAKEALKKSLAILDAHLSTRTYLVGDAVTLADIVACANVFLGFTKLFDAAYRKTIPNVTRWFDTCVHQPHFAAVLGDVPLADKAAVYDAAAEAPKPKNPLDLLPPSKMALDSWKRLYSNTPAAKFREVCVAGLWAGADIPNSPTQEHFVGFDPEGFSLWFCDYKYTDENTVNYVVMNKVREGWEGKANVYCGFLNRISPLFFPHPHLTPHPPHRSAASCSASTTPASTRSASCASSKTKRASSRFAACGSSAARTSPPK